jgi:hypothetical protein
MEDVKKCESRITSAKMKHLRKCMRKTGRDTIINSQI